MHPAATVLLLRERDGVLEALTMRRGSGLAFMAGMWVFPGGRVAAADSSPAALARVLPDAFDACRGRLHDRAGEPLDLVHTLALHVAACRETFEEAGVLLARDASGRPCGAARMERLQARRPQVVEDAAAFVAMLEEEDLWLDAAAFVYWSHWITPSIESKRFDTRFFAIAVPPDRAVSVDNSELNQHAWIRPSEAHAALARGEIRLAPPTLYTLEDLAECHARHGGLAAMLEAERGRPAPPVMPRIEIAPDEVRVLMPWDSRYESAAGDGCLPAGGYPPHLLRRRSCLILTRDREIRLSNEGPGPHRRAGAS
jgi:8-oxo-dGTP pyrophosphatase MutT (NUDIX family)